MEDLRKEYPVLQTHTYLNTASCGLLSNSLVVWRREEDRKLLEGGSVYRDTHRPRLQHVKQTIGRFFSALEDEIALIPNFSFGMNTVIEGLSRGKKILMLEKDYPSVNWPIEGRGFKTCYAAVDEHLEDNISRAIAQHQPDVFAFSMVQFTSGIKIDFEFLKQLKAYHPNLLLIADGTQYLGTENFSFAESPIDVVAASTYKWMLAGYGNALLMIKRAAQEHIFPNTIGFNSAEAVFSRKDEVALVKRFEPGHQDTLNYGSLEQSILNFERIGMQHISEKITQLSNFANISFAERGLLDEAVIRRTNHSNIFNIKGDAELFNKLAEHHIVCSQRGNGIRVSFHFYNTQDDVAKLLEVIQMSK